MIAKKAYKIYYWKNSYLRSGLIFRKESIE